MTRCHPASKETCFTALQKVVKEHPGRALTLLAVAVLFTLGLYFSLTRAFCSFEVEIACISGSSTLALITATFFICLALQKEVSKVVATQSFKQLERQLVKTLIPCATTPSPPPTSRLLIENPFRTPDVFIEYLLDPNIDDAVKKSTFETWRNGNTSPEKQRWLAEVIVKCMEKGVTLFFKKISGPAEKRIMEQKFKEMEAKQRRQLLMSLNPSIKKAIYPDMAPYLRPSEHGAFKIMQPIREIIEEKQE